MKTVGIRTLKDRLSETLRAVQGGERVTVTSRGAPVASLVPYAPHGLEAEDDLVRWARGGKVRIGSATAPPGYTRPPREDQLPHEEVLKILDWVRGGR